MAFQGCSHAYIVCGIDLIRAWCGPLPVSICGIAYWIRNMIFMEATFLVTIQIGLRYLFICRWKHMRVMKDDLIVLLVLICTCGGECMCTGMCLCMCTSRCRCNCSCRCVCRCTFVTLFVGVKVCQEFMINDTQTITCPTSGQGFLGDLPLPVQKARES